MNLFLSIWLKKFQNIVFFSFVFLIFILPLSLESIQASQSLRIGINDFPVSLNPVYATSESSQAVINKVFDGLFVFDCQGKIKNQLVKEIQILHQKKRQKKDKHLMANQPLEIIIELKKNFFFSDGKKLNSEDVLKTLKLLKDKRFKYPYASTLKIIDRLEKIDNFKLKLRLSYPVATWKKDFTFKILNANEIKNISPDDFRNMALSGTGIFTIKARIPLKKITLELNKHHPLFQSWQGYSSVEYHVIAYTQLSPLKLINQEIDVCELQPEHIATYMNSRQNKWKKYFRIIKYKKFGYTYLVFNLKNPLITNEIRNCFYNALIFNGFIERFLKGRGELVKSPFLLLNSRVEPINFKIISREKPLYLKILTNSESKLRKELILFLREELKPFNIFLQPEFLEYHSFLDKLKKAQFDTAVSGFNFNIDNDMSDILSTGAFFNYAQYQNPQMDELMKMGIKELNPQEREKIYLEAHNVWLKKKPLIPLFQLYYYMGISNHIKIPSKVMKVIGATGDFLNNIQEWKRGY